MLKLYNGSTSVCSVKVRVGLAEKGIEWEDVLLNLPKGEQHDPEYLKLNPNGVVPTLVDDDVIVIESSVILEYVDALSSENTLMPSDKAAMAETKVWLVRCLDIHAAINTMTFSTVMRDKILANKTPEEIEASIAKMPVPKMAAKRRDLIENGTDSQHVLSDFFTLRRMFDDMQAALEKSKWLTGDQIGLADVAVVAYVDRLERLGLEGLWQERTPKVGQWLKAMQARPSYARALERYVSAEESAATRAAAQKHWPKIKQSWEAFLRQ